MSRVFSFILRICRDTVELYLIDHFILKVQSSFHFIRKVSSWSYIEIDEVPIVAKIGGMNQDESSDPVEDIAEGKIIWLSGYQATELDLRDGEMVEIYFPDTGFEYDGRVRDFSGDAKQIELISHQTFQMTMDEAEKVAFPGPETIREWHNTDGEEGERKSTWREYEDQAPSETLYRMPLAEGA